MKPVLETTAEDLVGPVEQSVYGPVTAVQQVLPGMREVGRGTILFINGGSAVRPSGGVAGTSVAFAGESAYGQMLHDALARWHPCRAADHPARHRRRRARPRARRSRRPHLVPPP